MKGRTAQMAIGPGQVSRDIPAHQATPGGIAHDTRLSCAASTACSCSGMNPPVSGGSPR
jgi:hypothetical protein